MNSIILPVSDEDGLMLVSTRDFAAGLHIQHDSIIKTIREHQVRIEQDFGPLRFEIDADYQQVTGILRNSHVLLTEDQAIFIGTLSRNTERIIELKSVLVRSFAKARESKFNLPMTHEAAVEQLLAKIRENRLLAEEKQRLLVEQEANAPKVESYERTMAAEGLFEVSQVANVIGNGCGKIKLFRLLREKKIFFYRNGENRPSQYYVSASWFEVKHKTFAKGEDVEPYMQIFVTPLGVQKLTKIWDTYRAEQRNAQQIAANPNSATA